MFPGLLKGKDNHISDYLDESVQCVSIGNWVKLATLGNFLRHFAMQRAPGVSEPGVSDPKTFLTNLANV